MRKMLVVIILIASATVFISGCTTWNGISKTEKPGTYYVVTNRQKFPIGVSPGMLECTANSTGILTCEEVGIEYK